MKKILFIVVLIALFLFLAELGFNRFKQKTLFGASVTTMSRVVPSAAGNIPRLNIAGQAYDSTYGASASATANTFALRDGSGDLTAAAFHGSGAALTNLPSPSLANPALIGAMQVIRFYGDAGYESFVYGNGGTLLDTNDGNYKAEMNTLVGNQAGQSLTTGYGDTYVGFKAGNANTTANYQTALGLWAGKTCTGEGITALGYSAMWGDNITPCSATNTTAVGYRANETNVSGNNCTYIGAMSGLNNKTGENNTFVGLGSGLGNVGTPVSAGSNCGFGYYSMANIISGGENIAIGPSSMQSLQTGSYNVGIGSNSLVSLVSQSGNTATGWFSAYNASGNGNCAYGTGSLYSMTTGTFNCAYGYNFVSSQVTTGDYNSLYGAYAKPLAVGDSNETVVGANAVGHGTNTVTLGDTNTTALYVGNSAVGGAPLLVTITAAGPTLIDSSYIGKLITNAGATNDVIYQLDTRANLGSSFQCAFVNEVGTSQYTNAYGTGDRTATLTCTTNRAINAGTISQMIDGIKASDIDWDGSVDATGKYIRIQFPVAVVINEIKWYADKGVALGTFKVQGSQNGSSWTDIGSTQELTGLATYTITTVSANTTAYLYYQIIGTSGTWANDGYSRELEFQINALAVSNVTVIPATGEKLPGTIAINRKLVSQLPNDYLSIRTTTITGSGIIATGVYPAATNWADTAP